MVNNLMVQAKKNPPAGSRVKRQLELLNDGYVTLKADFTTLNFTKTRDTRIQDP